MKTDYKALTILLMLGLLCATACGNSDGHKKKYGDLTDRDFKHEVDTVDGKKIYFKTAQSADIPQKFASLKEEEINFIKVCSRNAVDIARTQLSDANTEHLTPEILDKLIDKWNEDSTKFSCSQHDFINAAGVAFGNYLVETYDMQWKTVSDEYGLDYATLNEHEHNLCSFPISSASKAIDQKRKGSLQVISLMIKRKLAKINGIR